MINFTLKEWGRYRVPHFWISLTDKNDKNGRKQNENNLLWDETSPF